MQTSRASRRSFRQLWNFAHRVAALLLFAIMVMAGFQTRAVAQTELPRIGPGPGLEQVHRSEGSRDGGADSQRAKTKAFDLSLEGAYSYNVGGGAVRIQATRVANNRLFGYSGTLRLELWATAAPYNGGAWVGYKLAQVRLDPLTAGWYYTNIDQTVPQLNALPNGTWYMTLFVTEYTGSILNDGYVSVDWGGFASTWVIGPPPVVSITVYELYNTNSKHYFRTSSAEELAGILVGSAGPGWSRTLDDFKAYPAASGSVGNDVCRFYSYASNSHFYTASDSECNSLRYSKGEWNYEGLAYRIQLPSNGGCSAGLKPVYRLYNGRYMFSDSNHRFTTSFSEAQRLSTTPNSWTYEGVAFCALN